MSKTESNLWRENPFQELENQRAQTVRDYILEELNKQPQVEPTQQLRLLEDQLTNTAAIVQQLLSVLPHMSGELGFAAGVAYQKNVTELYNMVKGWVGE